MSRRAAAQFPIGAVVAAARDNIAIGCSVPVGQVGTVAAIGAKTRHGRACRLLAIAYALVGWRKGLLFTPEIVQCRAFSATGAMRAFCVGLAALLARIMARTS